MQEGKIEKLENNIDSFCKDPESALSLFLAYLLSSPRVAKKHAKIYGINEDKVSKALNEIHEAQRNLDVNIKECINKFSTELEDVSRNRIKNLSSFELEILSYGAYTIRPHILNNDEMRIYIDIDKLGNALHRMFQIERKRAERIIIQLMIKTGLAFFNDGYFAIPPYSKRIINELAEQFEQKLKPFVDLILNSNDPKLISAILLAIHKHSKEDEQLFEAIYGENPYKGLQQIKFPYNQNYSYHSNHFLYDFLREPIAKGAIIHLNKIRDMITEALAKKGFEIKRIYGLGDNIHLYNTIVASRDYEVVIRISPFYYQLFDLLGKNKLQLYYGTEKGVIVLMAPIAKPDMLKEYNYVIVGLDNDYNVIKIVDNVNEDWSKEIVEIFKSLNDIVGLKKGVISEKDIITKVNAYRAKTREILEGVVATALDNLGFKVSVDEKMRTYSGIDIEVDVWAVKTPFKIYVSCKNYNGKLGSDIISNEIGRVMQLVETPTIKIIVASEFTDQARKVAVKNGFIPIELGFKVNENNVIKAYNVIYDILKKYFGAS